MATKLTNAERHGRDGARAMGLDPDAKEKAQHTAGPWAVGRLGDMCCLEIFAGEPSMDTGIATCWHRQQETPESIANSRLLAAAPELLAALEIMLADVISAKLADAGRLGFALTIPELRHRFPEVFTNVDLAQAAIRKARGE